MMLLALPVLAAAETGAVQTEDDVEPSVVTAEKSDSTAVTPKKSAYGKLLSGVTASASGLMDIYKVKSSYYLEIPDSLMGKPMLLASRVSGISDNSDVIAGQMPRDPLLLQWSRDDSRVYLLDAMNNAVCDTSETIFKGFELNNLKPVRNVQANRPEPK